VLCGKTRSNKLSECGGATDTPSKAPGDVANSISAGFINKNIDSRFDVLAEVFNHQGFPQMSFPTKT